MRHMLPTLSTVFGEPKERRDYFGRWHIEIQQSADYLHTCRQIVHEIQRLVCDKLSGGSPGYDEDGLFDQVSNWLKLCGKDPGAQTLNLRSLRFLPSCG